jgi:hypothetical protein
MERLIML